MRALWCAFEDQTFRERYYHWCNMYCIVLAVVGIIVATLFLAGKSQQRDTEQTEKMAEESDQKEATEEKKVEDADNM